MPLRFDLRMGILPMRLLLLLLGTRQSNCYVEVSDSAVEARMGPLFRKRFPRANVVSVRRRSVPWLLGYGWRLDLRGGVYLLASHRDVVEMELREPLRMWWVLPWRRLAVSVQDPDGLITALAER